MKISRVLHAGYVFDHGGARILFDPVFENPFSWNCYAFPAVTFDVEKIQTLKFDAIFISHYHDDHCSFESLSLLDRATPIYIYCAHQEMGDLLHELGFETVHFLSLSVSVHVGGIEVIALKALDDDLDCIFHIKAGGLNVLNLVDAWIDPETLTDLGRQVCWDLVLWPFQTMRELEVLCPLRAVSATPEIPAEWLEQLKLLGPRFVVPSSCQFRMEEWSWYNRAFFPISYSFFEREVLRVSPSTQMVRMAPGASLELSSDSIRRVERLAWIEPVGDQDVDYEYDPSLKAPDTAEIARNLGPLDPQAFERVVEYCRSGLKERYRQLAPSDYFKDSKIWKLSIYDHDGQPLHFHFRLEGQSLESCAEETIDWFTEVPAVKLLSALEQGESLTSMYVRINDRRFTPDVETALKDVDLLEDPLLRCLFNGAFAGYQRSQLRRIALPGATVTSDSSK